MNTLRVILSLWFALALLAPVTYAQIFTEPMPFTATGDTTEVRALTAWVDDHRHRHSNQARQVAERALTLAHTLNDEQGIAESSLLLALLTVDLQRAEVLLTAAHDAFEQIGDQYGLNRTRVVMGDIYSRGGDLEQALIYYFDALKNFELLNNIEGQSYSLSSIGVAHTSQGNLEEALSYFEKAAILADFLSDPVLITTIYNNLGIALAENGSYNRAEIVLRRALATSEEQIFDHLMFPVLNNLGYLFNVQGHYEHALSYLSIAEHLAKEMEENRLFGMYKELANAYMGLNEYDRALHYAHENLTLARELGVSHHSIAHRTLSQIYEAAGNNNQALIHYQQYAASRDSVFTAEKAGILADMHARYETDEKQREIERLEQQSQIQALQQTLLLVGVGSLLLLLGFLYYRYRTKQKANRLLEELDLAKSRFFANISHEFRTPLTVIRGGLQDTIAGRFGEVSEELATQQQVMLRNTHQLQNLINEVLDLNRLESGHLELRPAPGDLIRSLKHIVEANAPLAERNGITLTLMCDVEMCPRLYDEEKLEKIVGNLLSNALKFTPRGSSVRVDLRCEDQVEISVTDDGPGISSEAQTKIFERFAQLDHGGLKGGTGIGLSLAKELTELHGGTITLNSTPGKGSTFTVRLPLQAVALSDIRDTEAARVSLPELAVGGDGSDVSGVFAENRSGEETDRTTVLLIEDNDDVRAYVRRSLEETYRVFEARDGESGLHQAHEVLPDLIVSDVMLPDTDGYEIARQLKAAPDTECIPVVMLTARASESDHVTGYESGAEAYISKPFSPETLRAAIARLLEERKRLRRQLQAEPKQTSKNVSQPNLPTLSERIRVVVLENLHDEEFNVDQLASLLHVTRQTLYNRFKAELDSSPSDFIRVIRLERARELLSSGAGSVSEVAYAVGFKSMSHFTRSFRDYHGILPSSVSGTRVDEVN